MQVCNGLLCVCWFSLDVSGLSSFTYSCNINLKGIRCAAYKTNAQAGQATLYSNLRNRNHVGSRHCSVQQPKK